MEEQQRLTNERLAKLQKNVEVMSYQFREQREASSTLFNREMALVAMLVVVLQLLINWMLTQKAAAVGAGNVPEAPPPPPQV